jgi:protein-tyrosine phosphatase
VAQGVDLAVHASRYAGDEEVAAADAILVFDAANLGELARRGLPAQDRLALLGDFSDHPGDIEDPYGGSVEVFRDNYDRIVRAVDRLVADLQR